MKKVAIAMVAALLVTSAVPVAALAHGHRRNVAVRQQYYELCNVEDCVLAGIHTHDDVYYCGHYYGDGHDYHDYDLYYGSCGYRGGRHH